MRKKWRRARRREAKLSTHYIYPRCRFNSDLTIELPVYFHQSWHGVFGELTPEEASRFLETLLRHFKRGGTLSYKNIVLLREEVKRHN